MEQSSHHDRMTTALISDQVGTHPSITLEWPCTHIWSCKTTRMALSPRPSIPGNWPGTSIPRMAINAYFWSCRNQSYSHIRMAPSPRLSYLVTDQAPPFLEWHSMLTSDHVGTNPTVTSEWLNTHIWHGRNRSSPHDRMAHPLHLTMEGTNPFTMLEWLMDSSLPFVGNLDLENTKLLPKVLKTSL